MISSVSNPRIFGSVCVCVCTVSLKSTLQTLLPKSLSLLLMCGECCLSALLFLSPSLSFVPLLSFSSLSCSSSPSDTKPCLIHSSSPLSHCPTRLPSHFTSLYFCNFCIPFLSLSSVLVSGLPGKLFDAHAERTELHLHFSISLWNEIAECACIPRDTATFPSLFVPI